MAAARPTSATRPQSATFAASTPTCSAPRGAPSCSTTRVRCGPPALLQPPQPSSSPLLAVARCGTPSEPLPPTPRRPVFALTIHDTIHSHPAPPLTPYLPPVDGRQGFWHSALRAASCVGEALPARAAGRLPASQSGDVMKSRDEASNIPMSRRTFVHTGDGGEGGPMSFNGFFIAGAHKRPYIRESIDYRVSSLTL